MLSAQSTFLKYKITICQRTSSLYLPQRAARLLIFRAQNTEKLQLPMYPAAHSITTSTWVLAKGRRIRFKETNLALPCSSQLPVFRHLFLQCSIPFAEKENSSANRGWIFFLFVFLGKNNVKVILQIHNRFGHRFWQCLGHSWVWHWHSSLRTGVWQWVVTITQQKTADQRENPLKLQWWICVWDSIKLPDTAQKIGSNQDPTMFTLSAPTTAPTM